MIRCIIVDDEPLALSQMRGYAERVPFLECVAECSNATEAMTEIEKGGVDVMFLDVNMPGITGLQLVRNLANPPKVVFTTAYSEHAVEGFKVDAVDYILKPFGFDEFLRAASKVNNLCAMENAARCSREVRDDGCDESLFVKSDYRVLRVPIRSIRYVESMSEYVRIFVEGESKPIVSLLSMKKVEDSLPKEHFMRVHRSYIVNLHKVNEVSRMRIVYDGNVFVPIGDMYKEKFFEYIEEHYIGKK